MTAKATRSSTEPVVVLQRGREASLRRRHPWLFQSAIDRVEGKPAPGDTVVVRAARGEVAGRGAWSPRSKISVRMWTYGHQDPAVDEALIRARVNSALALRREHLRDERSGCRLIFAESDGLPGVIADRYADVLVCSFLSTGAERWREVIIDALVEALEPAAVFERSDSSMRGREGLEPRTGLLRGVEPPELVEIDERGCRYLVDVRRGHKTGFYLDQRESRTAVAARASGRLLNAFSYTGGFSVAALVASERGEGAVTSALDIDSSADALALAARNAERNGVDARREAIEGNVFEVLRRFRAEGRRFDTIVLDPPKFADSRARVKKAARGYKDINLLACQLLEPGGLLATFSCSGMLEPQLFQKIVADAALDAGRFGRIVQRLGHPDDHPLALAFPEGRYLKGLLVRVD
ncbi:MAG: class I SAM-dependent rRNA methyltransferase [Acidobacteriota bacterium]